MKIKTGVKWKNNPTVDNTVKDIKKPSKNEIHSFLLSNKPILKENNEKLSNIR